MNYILIFFVMCVKTQCYVTLKIGDLHSQQPEGAYMRGKEEVTYNHVRNKLFEPTIVHRLKPAMFPINYLNINQRSVWIEMHSSWVTFYSFEIYYFRTEITNLGGNSPQCLSDYGD